MNAFSSNWQNVITWRGRDAFTLSLTWWRHQMETFSTSLAICAGNSPVPGEFPAQRPVTRSFGVFFDLRLNKWLSKQSWGWWFETLSRPLWRHCNDNMPWWYLSVRIYSGYCRITPNIMVYLYSIPYKFVEQFINKLNSKITAVFDRTKFQNEQIT